MEGGQPSSFREVVADERASAPILRPERRRITGSSTTTAPIVALPQPRPARQQYSFGLSDAPGLVSQRARLRDAIFRRSLILADVLATGLAMTFAVRVIAGAGLRPAVVGGLLAVVFAGKVLGLYDRDELVFNKSTLDELPKLFQLGACCTLVAWLLGPALAFVLFAVFRYAARTLAGLAAPAERCLIIGRSGTRMRLAGKLTAAQPQARVVGYLPLDEERRAGRSAQWKGTDRRRRALAIEDLPDLVAELDVHRVVIIPGEADPATMIDTISRAKAAGVKVSILPRLFEIVGSSIEFDNVEGLTVLGVRRFGLSRSSAAIKRTTDIVGAGVGIVVLAPLFAVVAIAIKLDSRGPVFYRQTRVGRGGRVFDMLKLRSMIVGADDMKPELLPRNAAAGGLFKMIDDPRITRVGRLIRKASIDELPQLINVLLGEMSLVGPRPLVPDEAHQVDGHYRRRLRLVPGMTGPWQILGPVRVPLAEMVVLDYLYGANWSLWLDIKIILRTIVHVVRGDGL